MFCRVELRSLRDADAPILQQLLSDESVTDYLDEIPKPYTLEDAKALIFFSQGMGSSGRNFAIVANGKFVGVIGIKYGSGIRYKAGEIGYYIQPKYHNKGIGTQAICKITEFGFEKHKLVRISAVVLAHNIPSCRALEKAGYRLECVQRNGWSKKDIVGDMRVYVKLYDQ